MRLVCFYKVYQCIALQKLFFQRSIVIKVARGLLFKKPSPSWEIFLSTWYFNLRCAWPVFKKPSQCIAFQKLFFQRSIVIKVARGLLFKKPSPSWEIFLSTWYFNLRCAWPVFKKPSQCIAFQKLFFQRGIVIKVARDLFLKILPFLKYFSFKMVFPSKMRLACLKPSQCIPFQKFFFQRGIVMKNLFGSWPL